MPIIGKLLKRTNAITYHRNLKKKKDLDNQLQTLIKLLSKARKTRFGIRCDFSEVLEAENLTSAFQKNVPITDYEEFHDRWLKETIIGAKDHTWPGRIKHYALSSGTTGSPSKRIPVTNQMIRSFQKSSLSQMVTLHELNLSEEFYGGQLLVVGGSSKLVRKDNHFEGDLSGILKKYTSFIVAPLTKPGNKITALTDWNVKLAMMVEKAPEWNIGIIAGVPSWCILLMEKIVEHHQLDSIHDIWPNLEVYVHGGVFMEPYMQRLEKVVAREIVLLDTYLASEGYFAYQKNPAKKGMQLMLNSGVFFEFIPFNSDYFDEDGELKDRTTAFTIDEVEPDIDYAIVVTTNAGLWRYLMGDLVRFVDIEQREIILSGRIKQFLSLCGEHLSLDNINQAIHTVALRKGICISEFTICADEEGLVHHWYIGCDAAFSASELMQELDAELCALNDDYRSSRKMNLKDPQLVVLPVERFYQFMEMKGKLGSQNKFPRVLNKEQRAEWKEFIAS